MAVQPIPGRLDRVPFWRVTMVYGDEEGPGFAYTTGLHDHGLPELHIWAQPDRGDDPGADWRFSTRNEGHLLNRLAWQVVDGTLHPGSEFSDVFDDGEITVRFRIGPPGDRLALEAYGTAEDATIWPVNWSLHRPPVAQPSPLSEDALAAAHVEVDELVSSLASPSGPGFEVPDPWRTESPPRFGPEQVFGPRTPLVRLRAAQLLSATPEAVGSLLESASRVACYDSLTTPTSVARAVARSAGRTVAVDAVAREAEGLADSYLDRAVRDGSWLAALDSGFGPQLEGGARLFEVIDDHCRTDLVQLTVACLTVEAVADVIDPYWVCHAHGPWLTALRCRPGELPGPDWQAPAGVLDTVSDLLAPLSAADLMQIAHEHTLTVGGWKIDLDYRGLVERLQTWALLGRAGCPWDPTLESLPGWADVLGPLGLAGPDGQPRVGASVGRLPELHGWVQALVSALSHRGRLTADDVALFVRPVAETLPDLEACVNELR